MNIDSFLSLFSPVRKTLHGWQVHCPVHEDNNASLSIGIGKNGDIILKCHAGCSTEEIIEKLNLKMSDLFLNDNQYDKQQKKIYTGKTRKETRYPYHDKNGNYLYDSVRIDIPGKPKEFRIMVREKYGFNKIKPVLYNLHKINDAIVNEETIFCPEGEKQCDNLEKIGLIGTTNPLGAGKWHESYSDSLTFANIVLLPDNDEPGEKHVELVAESLINYAKSIKILRLPGLPEKGDVTDWIESGGTKKQLLELAASAPNYEPKKKMIQK